MTKPGWLRTMLLLVILAGAGVAQTAFDSPTLQAWRSAGIRFAVFDIRGDTQIDSIIYPCFYTTQPEQWVDSLCRVIRVVISCHAGIAAQVKAQEIAASGYPVDSLFYTGYNLMTTHFPARDTLPLDFLRPGHPLPQSLLTTAIWAITLGNRPYQLIDVRGTTEIASGMIPGACNLIWPTPFQSSLDLLSKTTNTILYCASGNRAGQARSFMLLNGFDSSRVINFGGFGKWSALTTAPVTTTPSANCLCPCSSTGIKPNYPAAPLTSLILSPLPFKNQLTISGLPAGSTGLIMYNSRGWAVRTFGPNDLSQRMVAWDGTDHIGRQQPPGVYFIRVTAGTAENNFAALKTE